jgi:hypothetical protein
MYCLFFPVLVWLLTNYRHQWIFITDTVDAVFRPDDWSPESMFDRLAEVVGSLPIPEPRVCYLLPTI